MSLSLSTAGELTGTEERLFSYLKDYLQSEGSISAATTAERIDKEKPSLPNTDPEAFCHDTWHVFRQLVDQIPHDHPYQDRLVAVIDELTKLPATEVKIWGSNACLWKDLPLLGPDMRESWNPPEYNSKKPDSWPEKAQKWLNLNGFAARLLNIESVTWDNFGLWVMRDTLENEQSGPEFENGLDAVGIWIKYAGRVMFERSKAPDTPEDRMFKPGPLFSGPSMYCLERWTFWKERLGQITTQGETTSRAQETRKAMEEIESRQ